MLKNVKKFYKGYSLYESVFVSGMVSISVFLAIRVLFLQFNYLYGASFAGIASFAALLVTFFIVFLSFSALKLTIRLDRRKKLLLLAEVLFSLTVVYMVLL